MTLDVPTASFVLDAGTDITSVLSELATRVGGTVETAAAGPPTTSTVVDTADRLLRAAGLALVRTADPSGLAGAGAAGRRAPGSPNPPAVASGSPGSPQPRPGDLFLVLRGASGDPSLVERVPVARRYLISELPEGRLRQRLAPIVDIRALLPIVDVRRREARAVVRNQASKAVARVTGVQLWAVPAGPPGSRSDGEPDAGSETEPVALGSRVEVSGVLGYPKAFDRVRDVLATQLGLPEADEDVADEAVIALGGIPQGLPGKPDVGLMPGDRADLAAVRILRSLAHVVEANLPGTIDDLDTEFLHDLRVAVRKSRSVLRELKGVFDPDARRAQADALRWVQAVTGPTRDLDVQLLEWDDIASRVPPDRREHLEPVRALLAGQREVAYQTLVATLQGDELRRRWAGWRAFLGGDLGPEEQRPDAALPIRDVAGRRVRRVYGRMVRMGDAIDSQSPPQALHDLRKRGKELRYLLDFFGVLWPPAVVKPMLTSLKGLQDVLGTHQDREVQAVQLRSLAPSLAKVPDGGPEALLAMGSLIDRLDVAQVEARHGFAERFAAFKGLEVPG